MDLYQEYIYKSRYTKSNENFEQIVDRTLNFLKIPDNKWFKIEDLRKMMINLEVMPSMRLLATAGEAANRDNAAIFNCSYTPVDSITTFGEVLYLLTCRVGVGFSVEKKFINLLPTIPKINKIDTTIIVEDDREGWKNSFDALINYLYKGIEPNIDYTKIRKQGEPLKVFGGFSSGFEALKVLFDFTISIFKNNIDKKLEPINCYDILTKCAECIEKGGVQNTAMMCIFDLDDKDMLKAKSGDWYIKYPHRRHANNSVVLNKTLTQLEFMDLWNTLAQSKSGEPGIFNRVSANLREPHPDCGLNPCGEVILRPRSFCNLSEVICRPTDTFEDLELKLIMATIINVHQSLFTNFRCLSKEWKFNCDNHRLLGVSLTGIMDSPACRLYLQDLKQIVINTANEYCDHLGISRPERYTCVKPSGTVSQLCGCSSGIHPAISEYYIRTVTQARETNTYKLLVQSGIPHEPSLVNPLKDCFFFPKKAASTYAINDYNLVYNYCKLFTKHYADHNVSATIYIDDNEWLQFGLNVFRDLNSIIGMAFLPKFNTIYSQLPFQQCTKEVYESLLKKMPQSINWNKSVENVEVPECSSGVCEINKLNK